MVWKVLKAEKTSLLCLRRYNHVIHVQSSMNVTNHRIPDEVVIGDGPQTSE